jgi:hypothetical protein
MKEHHMLIRQGGAFILNQYIGEKMSERYTDSARFHAALDRNITRIPDPEDFCCPSGRLLPLYYEGKSYTDMWICLIDCKECEEQCVPYNFRNNSGEW